MIMYVCAFVVWLLDSQTNFHVNRHTKAEIHATQHWKNNEYHALRFVSERIYDTPHEKAQSALNMIEP